MAVADADADAETRSPRAERTRTLIADALLSLLEEGDLQPTATRIAERAGISLRLIYHHFGDLECLFRVLAQREGFRMLQRIEPIPLDLPFDERLDRFVRQRCRLLEWLTPVCRAAQLQEPFSRALQEARDAGLAMSEQEINHLFAAELDRLPDAERVVRLDALVTATGWPAWNAMRINGKSFERSQAVVDRLARLVLSADLR
jgi:AcrR family transcriptional regulator